MHSHTKGMALDRDVNLEKLAEITDRFTGADIAGVCMKAGLYALRENPEARAVMMEHFFRSDRIQKRRVKESIKKRSGRKYPARPFLGRAE